MSRIAQLAQVYAPTAPVRARGPVGLPPGAGLREPVPPVKAVGREQSGLPAQQARAPHLRVVGEEATRERPSQTGTAAAERPRSWPQALAQGPSPAFTAQLLGQNAYPDDRRALAGYGHDLPGQKDSARLGSEIYRRVGAEPALLGEGPTFLKLAV